MNKKTAFRAITVWESECGENFFDTNIEFDTRIFMFWCLGRGYISQEQMDVWVADWLNPRRRLFASNASFPGEWLYCYHSPQWCDELGYCIVKSDGWQQRAHDRAYMILAEFLIATSEYESRLKRALANNLLPGGRSLRITDNEIRVIVE